MTNNVMLENHNKATEIINEMVKECTGQMIGIGIPVQVDCIQNVFLTKLRNTQAGCYFKEEKGQFIFLIAIHETFVKYMDDAVVLENVRNSIYHELLHTCPNAQTHNETWVKWAKMCDEMLGTQTRVYKERKVYYNTLKGVPNVYRCEECGYEYHSVNALNDTTCDICGKNMI